MINKYILGILVISLVLISGCTELPESEPTYTEKHEARKAVFDEVKRSYDEGEILYWEGLKISKLTNYEAFKNECGSGIVVHVVELPYWVVKEDIIYCINGLAKTYTPNLEYIPTGNESNCLFSTYIH